MTTSTITPDTAAELHDSAPAGTVFSFPADRLPEARKRIEAANARLARNSITERFTYTTTEYLQKSETGALAQFVRLELSAPQISFSGYTFLAVVERPDGNLSDGAAPEAALVVRSHPGVELGGWRPTTMRCDHCGHLRSRAKTYLLAAADGNRLQVGSTCLAPFLGLRPSGLWALTYDGLDDIEKYEADDYFGTTPAARQRQMYAVREILAVALAVSDEGRGFVPRSASHAGKPATIDTVGKVIWEGHRETHQDRAWRAEQRAQAARHEADGTVDQVLTDIRALNGDSDYVTNLQTIAAGEHVTARHMALLVSALRTYRVAREKAATQATYVPGFMAPVETKVEGERLTVVRVRHTQEEGWGYNAGLVERTQVVMHDGAGHEVVWWASTKQDVEEGQVLLLTGGSVKAHKEYQGRDQTVLTRVKYEVA